MAYTYDDRGFILSMTKDANNYSQYTYNGLGELESEIYNWGSTIYKMVYVYDAGGNIDYKTKYIKVNDEWQVADTIDYTYDTTWKDKLASYDGASISYDNIGNPLSDGTWAYTWTQGRRLSSISNGTTSASYKYNNDGIRTEKTVNGTTTIYNLVGSNITWEKTDSETAIYYYYNPNGTLVGLNYNFYIRNAQGEIIKLISETGAVVVEYTYDAWGNTMSTTGSMAATLGSDNPFRYKGYYYDSETGIYYLNSRYYNPEWGRFISADSVIGQAGGLFTHNLFAYCVNNPVMYSDSSGALIDTIIDIFFCLVDVVAVIIDPSVENQAALAADAVCLTIPFATGGGLVVRGASKIDDALRIANAAGDAVSAGNKAVKGFGALSKAEKYGIKTYKELTKLLKGTGLRAHHIIEQRLADALGLNVRQMLSVAVTDAEHQIFTNAWRKLIPYGTDYRLLTKGEIWGYAQQVYKNFPDLLDAAYKTLFG